MRFRNDYIGYLTLDDPKVITSKTKQQQSNDRINRLELWFHSAYAFIYDSFGVFVDLDCLVWR